MFLIVQSIKPLDTWLADLTYFLSSLGLPAVTPLPIQSSQKRYSAIQLRLDSHPIAAPLKEHLATYCRNHHLNWAWMPHPYTQNQIGLIAFDMDSTFITIECIDEIADYLGIKEQVARITESAMRGELDFATSLRERVRLLSGVPLDALASIYENRLQLSPGAVTLVNSAKELGIKTLLVSGGFTFFTERLRKAYEIDFAVANQLAILDNQLTGSLAGEIVDGIAKARWLQSIYQEHCTAEQIMVAIGDGANDLPMLQTAHVGIAYRAKPLVQAQASAVINHGGLDAAFAFFSAR